MKPEERFTFTTLADASRVCGQMAHEIETHLAQIAGLTAIARALIATHSNYEQMQLALTSHLEHMLGKMPDSALSAVQNEKARDFVENLQSTPPAPMIRPVR